MENEQKTFKEKLNMLLCMNGGVNDRAVRLLGGSQNYKLKVMCRLREEQWIEKINNITRYTKDTAEVVEGNPQKYPYGYMARKQRDGYITSGKQRMQRILKQGETLAMMIEAGIEICESDITDLPNRIVYVKSSRIKELQEYRDKQALTRSRNMGTLFVGSEALYNIYTFGNQNQTWEILAESLSKEVAERVSQDRYGKALKCKAAVLVNNLEIIKSMTRIIKRGGGVVAGDIYPQLYVIPKTDTGTRLLGLLVLPGTEKILDGMVKEEDALNFIVPDAVRLRRYRIRHGSAGKVWCIKGYEDAIRKAMPDAEIKTMSIDDVITSVLAKMQD